MGAGVKPLVLIAFICGYDAETDRYTRDCGAYEHEAASMQDCRDMAEWLRGTSPSGVRLVRFECFRAAERKPAVARRDQ